MKCRNKNVNRRFIDTSILNNETYINYLERLKVVALSLFEWVNLPKSMNPEFLELCLYNYGQASMLYTEEYGYINTKCVTNGNLNLYLLPSSLSCYSADSVNYNRKLYNGFKNEVDDVANYCILVMNNFEAIPTEPTLQLFALRLYEAERTCDVNIKAQKTPVLILVDENTGENEIVVLPGANCEFTKEDTDSLEELIKEKTEINKIIKDINTFQRCACIKIP